MPLIVNFRCSTAKVSYLFYFISLVICCRRTELRNAPFKNVIIIIIIFNNNNKTLLIIKTSIQNIV